MTSEYPTPPKAEDLQEQRAAAVAAQAEEQLKVEDLKIGYVVGLTETGDFVFQVVGKDPNLLELLGLQKYAEARVQQVFNNQRNSGDKLVLEVGKVVGALVQEVAKLTVLLKKPDNKLG